MSKKYLIFNKPFDVLSSFTGDAGQITLKAFIPVEDVYSAGRLDRDSEGLLLLTDDGGLIHRLTDPRFHLPKTYLAQIEGLPTQESLSALERGVVIQGERTRRCQIIQVDDPGWGERSKPVTPHGPVSWVRLVIHEGRKRQIRHMLAAVGLPVLRLIRVAIGPLSISDLGVGEWRFLTEKERTLLIKSVNK